MLGSLTRTNYAWLALELDLLMCTINIMRNMVLLG
jgi:hypothetical protein